MSCENNTARASAAAAQNGIPTTASKSSYSIATTLIKTTSTAAGVALGMGLGSAIAPGLGTIALGLSGGYVGNKVGGVLANKARERAEQAALERTWKKSPAGQKAIATRNERLRAARTSYDGAMTGIKSKEKAIKQTYEQSRADWLKANSGTSAIRAGDFGKAIASPEAKAALGSLAAGTIRVLVQTSGGQRTSSVGDGESKPPTLGDRIARETLMQATSEYKTRLEGARELAWLDSPEGRVAKEDYDRGMAQVKGARQKAAQKYSEAKQVIESRYGAARTKFFNQFQQHLAHR